MPNKFAILQWMDRDDALAANNARARSLQANALYDDIADTVSQVRRGEIDDKQARVIIWANQWRAGKLRPKRYGDRREARKHGGDIHPAAWEALLALPEHISEGRRR